MNGLRACFFPTMLTVRFSPIVTILPTPVIPEAMPALVDYDSDFDTLLLERKAKKQKAASRKRVDKTRLVKSVRFAEPRAPPAPVAAVRTLCDTCHADVAIGCDCSELVAAYGGVCCSACGYSYRNPYGMLSHSDGRWVECWGRFVLPTCAKCSPVYVAKRATCEAADMALYTEALEWEYEKMTNRGW